MDPKKTLALAQQTLDIEASALIELRDRLKEAKQSKAFLDAIETILHCPGRLIVSGMGKSGHIARKIASTMASTGTPAYFVHPAEASHGDLGMITQDDVLIALSNSGESEEIVNILPHLKRQGAKIISMTGKPDSTLAQNTDIHINVAIAEEACPLNLAPTASTTAALAMGDALAIGLLDARGFDANDFALSHPGGSLGKRLLTRVQDVMRAGQSLSSTTVDSPLTQAILAISKDGLGMVCVVDPSQRIIGIVTDGDLRRAFENKINLSQSCVGDSMTKSPHTITADALAVEAVSIMEQHQINQLLVTDHEQKLIGALNMHDLFRAKVI